MVRVGGVLGKCNMRGALGLILGCVVAAVVIAGVFFFVLSPRADLAAPQTVAARLAEIGRASCRERV